MKKIGYLGMGAWGYCLASLLAAKGEYELVCWTTKPDLAKHLNQTHEHPLLPGHRSKGQMTFTTDMAHALHDADIIIESVTSAGLRPVFEHVRSLGLPSCPIIITSKGIEQDTGNILPEVAIEVLGEEFRPLIGCLSGPSFAQEVIRGLPTSVVGTGYSMEVIQRVCEIFMTPTFRIYPNSDILGVAFGGALKNIIGIACGISEGLALGCSSKAALMTRGLHEIRKLAVACGCKPETINGLAGMGDLCVTCSSPISRNFRFGMLLAQGLSSEEAQQRIGMVVEGAYTCISALQLSKQYQVKMPIAETVYDILQNFIRPTDAVSALMQRAIKEEHL
ncbi:NAD(P)H-dependent glycerol-3-phosphate dehydrogenase [Candidatus Protochlamydia phocaeensis]|uniref:NAD(P)H-dependent glycerol-3-phosphate dehydrogenase n=1 Tax=Candidatus Protochlamydia phocaeensis TaxID=1414722 RepID=UPI0009AD2BAC|nr:NAD(P)H-dependent glycerol-3-phosphate dehydrogenase [Candidatus Protochlamydia phocaeensis]